MAIKAGRFLILFVYIDITYMAMFQSITYQLFSYSRTYGTRVNKEHFKHSSINAHESFYTSIVTNHVKRHTMKINTPYQWL